MAIDLEIERDLSLIFERDEIRDAFSGHCAKTHGDESVDIRDCPYCSVFLARLAVAITEWLALVDQDRANRAARRSREDGQP